MAGTETAIGPFSRTFRLAMIVGLIVLLAQIYLNKPEDRAIVTCWPLYKAYHSVVVDLPQVVLPKEHGFHLKAIRHTGNMQDHCIHYAKFMPGYS